jgi:hypothetical protein
LAAFGAPECALDDIRHMLSTFQSQGFLSIERETATASVAER